MALLYLIVACSYQYLVRPENIQWFQAIYYLSSFFGLFGSHTTSFLLAGALTPGVPAAGHLGLHPRLPCAACARKGAEPPAQAVTDATRRRSRELPHQRACHLPRHQRGLRQDRLHLRRRVV